MRNKASNYGPPTPQGTTAAIEVSAGTFALDFYDPSGGFITEVDGTVTGTRISAD